MHGVLTNYHFQPYYIIYFISNTYRPDFWYVFIKIDIRSSNLVQFSPIEATLVSKF
jgi:hypothetical protein